MDAAVAARLGSLDRPAPWINVTTALRFMADDGHIVLHPVRTSLALPFSARLRACVLELACT